MHVSCPVCRHHVDASSRGAAHPPPDRALGQGVAQTQDRLAASAQDEQKKWAPRAEIEPATASGAQMLGMYAVLAAGTAFVLLLAVIGISGDAAEPFEPRLWTRLVGRLTAASFRDSALGLMAVVAGLSVALVALSWPRRAGESPVRHPQIWLASVLEDAQRESTALVIMVTLSGLFGGVAFLYLVSAVVAVHEGQAVEGEVVVGVSLLVVAGSVALLPTLMRRSQTGVLSGYTRLVQRLVNLARWTVLHEDGFGARVASGLRHSSVSSLRQAAYYLRFFALCLGTDVIVICLVGQFNGAAWGRTAGLAASLSTLSAITGCCAIWLAVDVLKSVILRRRYYLLRLLSILLFCAPTWLIVLLGVVALDRHAGRGWWAVVDLVLSVAVTWWVLPLLGGVVFGRRRSFVRNRLREQLVVECGRVRKWLRAYASESPDLDGDMRIVRDLIVPEQAYLVPRLVTEGRSWRDRVYPGLWVGGADVWELRHPDEWGEEAGGRSRSEGTDGQVVIPDGRQNLHEYLATELGVDLRGARSTGPL